MSDRVVTAKVIEELTEAASLEGTEVGEYWGLLVDLWLRARDAGSDKFLAALKEELLEQYDYLHEEYRLVEEERVERRKVKVLQRSEEWE